MIPNRHKASALLAAMLGAAASVSAQEIPSDTGANTTYSRTVTQRVDKIVSALGVADTVKAARVRDIIVQQYLHLSAIHEARDAKIKALNGAAGDKSVTEARTKDARDEAKGKLEKLHAEFLSRLSAALSPEQIDRVKDGMTYGVVQVTYNAYLKMIPDLTEAQKQQIMSWLVEARELAMDEGTSDEKHKVFGKYKGRINNYLSAVGYNLKEAEKNLRK